MIDKVLIVTDLGPGDGGKGTIVHSLSKSEKASVIIKRGGAQGSHGVRTSTGEKFNFSQWGCGTLEGIPTFCSEQLVLSPIGLWNEHHVLSHMGFYDPFKLLTVDPNCICATPYHTISSQFEEIYLGDNHRGTIGTGVGQAYRMYQASGDLMTIRAKELSDQNIISTKLKCQIEFYRKKYMDYPTDVGNVEDNEIIQNGLYLLEDSGYLDFIVETFLWIGQRLKFSNLSDVLQKYDGTAIIECSHGILTDAETGLKPHVSAIRTLPEFTNQMLRDSGYTNEIINLAVHRAYEIRHGAGPMPTFDREFTNEMLPGSHKDNNRWQGEVRAGPLDMNLIRYALEQTKIHFDGICLTWFDQILKIGQAWNLCLSYQKNEYSNPTEYFFNAIPVITGYKGVLDARTNEELFDNVNRVLLNTIGIPLYILSVGPTELDKITRRK